MRFSWFFTRSLAFSHVETSSEATFASSRTGLPALWRAKRPESCPFMAARSDGGVLGWVFRWFWGCFF